MPLNYSRCDQCGQEDDHPKVHVADGGSFHHDCTAADLRAAMVAANPQVQQIIDECEAGTRGDDLRTFILALPQEG